MSGKIVVGPANATALTPFNPLKIAFDPKTYYTEPSAFDNGGAGTGRIRFVDPWLDTAWFQPLRL